MKKDLIVALLIFTIAVFFWRNAFFNFFTQDDFIFIEYFSQNNFWQDLTNAFGPPVVTHWRPFHNLFFLIAGNLFGKSYYLYHALILFLHVSTGFLIYKILVKIWGNFSLALVSSLIYVIHPAHFVAMYWISGSAINIGFFFLLLSFYLFLIGRKFASISFFILALLGSESMIMGAALFIFARRTPRAFSSRVNAQERIHTSEDWGYSARSCIQCHAVLALRAAGLKLEMIIPRPVRPRKFIVSSFLGKKEKLDRKFLLAIALVTFVFLIIKLANTSAAAFEIYKLEISSATLFALYYYALRILGFAESSGDFVSSIILVIFLLVVAWRGLNYLLPNWKKTILAAGSFFGLFPFVLLPSHLSPHYMVLPIFGFSQFLAFGLIRFSKILVIVGFLIFASISFLNIEITEKNNWAVERSSFAKKYLQDLEEKNLARGSTIVIDSKESYIALGQGSAIDFWFGRNYYKKCFSFLEDCEKTVNKSGESITAIGT